MTVKDGEIAAELGFSSFVWLAYLFVLDDVGRHPVRFLVAVTACQSMVA
jgi:hypothetical protein